jgi:transposase
MYYIGLDVHKKSISFCIKDAGGQIHQQGKVVATRRELDVWMKTLPQPWTAALEATIFTGWIYDHLKAHATAVKVAHPLMLRAIAASKKKNNRVDASKIADCLRCDFLPECYMDTIEIRERRRTLRYRNLLVRQVVQLKTRVASLPMETGVRYDRQHLHRLGSISELLADKDAIDQSVRPLSASSCQRLSFQTDKRRKIYRARMDEGRKRVLGIMAAILASLHMQTADDLFCRAKVSQACAIRSSRPSTILVLICPKSKSSARTRRRTTRSLLETGKALWSCAAWTIAPVT